MKISLEWINELIDTKIMDYQILKNKLTLGGFEVEDILTIEVNNRQIIVLDIATTANRSDSLSVQGLTLEIAALLNNPIKLYPYINKPFSWYQKINSLNKLIVSNSTKHYSIFITVLVEPLTNILVPKWLIQKLIISGITPKNNLLDFRDYILVETGYPFEFYDFKRIISKLKNVSAFEFRLRYGKQKEQFYSGENLYYSLNNSILVLNADTLPISIAGIIPNYEFDYSTNTKSLLIEGSIFDSSKVRQQSRILGLRSDRSARYEKYLKNITLIESLYKLILLIRISNPYINCKFHTFSQFSQKVSKQIKINKTILKEILGPINKSSYVSPSNVTNSLTRLNFSFYFNVLECKWTVIVPYSRSDDIIDEIDVIEEIGRLFGFNEFLTRLPIIKSIGIEDSHYKSRKKIVLSLLNLGLTESINYSFCNKITYYRSNTNIKDIRLINPLITDYQNLRVSLLPNILKSIQENIKRGNLLIENFECGHIFLVNDLINYSEKECIAGVFHGVSNGLKNNLDSLELDWFKAKGKVEYLFMKLNCIIYWKLAKFSFVNKQVLNSTNNMYITLFHPYRTAYIYLTDNIKIGLLGQIHPRIANKLNILKNLYLFEFDFKTINNQLQSNKTAIYSQSSIYPKINKDLSFFVNKKIKFTEIKNMLYFNGTKFLISVNLLDQYENTSDLSSLCVQLTFQSFYKTLKTPEIDSILKDLQLLLIDKFNVVIRE